MSNTATEPQAAPARVATKRTILMCKPTHYTVSYRSTRGCTPRSRPTRRRPSSSGSRSSTSTSSSASTSRTSSRSRVCRTWSTRPTAASCSTASRTARSSSTPSASPRVPPTWTGSAARRLTVAEPEETNEGEGDFLLIGDTIFAGTGFRSDSTSHEELARIYGREVVTLKLINPSFYHLDTAIAVLDPEPDASGRSNIAYLESAFDEPSLAILRERFPDAIIATEEDAAILGLNSYSDGYNVVIASRATTFAEQLREKGYNPIGVDLSELLLGGGGVKCCTLDLHPVGTGTSVAR